VDRLAVADEVVMRPHELPQRRIDRVEKDVGEKAINTGVGAAGV
jgi:hypothetical protein